MSNKATLETIDGSRSKLTGESSVAIPVTAAKPKVKPVKPKAVAVEATEEEAAAAFEEPIGSVIDRDPATASDNLRILVSRIEKVKANSIEWQNLSHPQRLMMTGALYAAKEALGEKDNGVQISFARFLGVTFR